MSRRVLLLIVAVCLIAGAGWWLVSASAASPLEFGELCPVHVRDVERIVVRDGATGEAASSAHIDDVEAVFEVLKATEYKPARRSEPTAGWTLVIDIYDSEDTYFRIQLQGQVVKTMEMTTGDGPKGAVRSFEMYDEPGVTAQLFEIFESLPEGWH